MAQLIKITQKQAPQFRALIKSADTGNLFDPSTDLATAAELEQEGIELPPISCTVYQSTNPIAPYNFNTNQAVPVEGFVNVEIDPDAILDPADVGSLDYNFAVTLDNRVNFAFANAGIYFVDFLMYPKLGAAIAWRTGVEVT